MPRIRPAVRTVFGPQHREIEAQRYDEIQRRIEQYRQAEAADQAEQAANAGRVARVRAELMRLRIAPTAASLLDFD